LARISFEYADFKEYKCKDHGSFYLKKSTNKIYAWRENQAVEIKLAKKHYQENNDESTDEDNTIYKCPYCRTYLNKGNNFGEYLGCVCKYCGTYYIKNDEYYRLSDHDKLRKIQFARDYFTRGITDEKDIKLILKTIEEKGY